MLGVDQSSQMLRIARAAAAARGASFGRASLLDVALPPYAAVPARGTRRIVSFRRVGTLYRRSEDLHRLQLYRPAEVLRELRRAGFPARPVGECGVIRFPNGWRGFVAGKRDFPSATAAREVRSKRRPRIAHKTL